MMLRLKTIIGISLLASSSLAALGAKAAQSDEPVANAGVVEDELEFTAEIWADNWFALYVNGQLVGEDSEPITKMRSFNSDTITFKATYPMTVAIVTKDFIENDSGLEYIGSLFGLLQIADWFTLTQQIGDGGFIAQIKETESQNLVAATSNKWRGYSVHKAPLNPGCEKSRQPLQDCEWLIRPEPEGWLLADFDDSEWITAREYTQEQIGARFGYHNVDWDAGAKLIWTDDIDADNTILWRHRIERP